MTIKSCQNCGKDVKCSPSNEHIRRFCSFECRKSIYTPEMRAKMSRIKKQQFASGVSPWNKGKEMTAEYKKTVSDTLRGVKRELSRNWKGGISKINQQMRSSPEYQTWRKEVIERDDYRCMDCGERGGTLQVDHIFAFAKFPRLRLEPMNGQTLCKNCHKIKTFPVALTI